MNRTLYYGEGVFESIRWRGENRKLKLHYERLRSSAEFFGIPCPSYKDFVFEITTAVGGEINKYVKYCLFSEGDDYFAGDSRSYKSKVVVKELPTPPKEVNLCLSPYRRHSLNPLCKHKSMNYLFNVLVKREVRSRGFFDGVVLNERDEVTECSSSNLLLLKAGRLITPSRESGLLWGTTLEVLSREIEISEGRVSLEGLMNADSVFILNSLMGIVPVSSFEDRSFEPNRGLVRELNSVLEEYES